MYMVCDVVGDLMTLGIGKNITDAGRCSAVDWNMLATASSSMKPSSTICPVLGGNPLSVWYGRN